MGPSICFNRILLATDGSDEAAAAVDATLAFAHGSPAEVRVVHVLNLEIHQRHGRRDGEVRIEARQLLDSTVDRLRTAGLHAGSAILRADSGHVAAAVAINAINFGADLMVIGSRLSNWQAMVDSTVSHQLVATVDCPLLIVRGRRAAVRPPQRVLLAIAGGEDIGPATHAAMAAASAPGSLVLVVHAADLTAGARGVVYSVIEDEIQATIASAIKLIEDAGIAARGVVAHSGRVADVIARVADMWEVDVIVAGSSRIGDLVSMVLGSVSRDMLHASVRPVPVAEPVLS